MSMFLSMLKIEKGFAADSLELRASNGLALEIRPLINDPLLDKPGRDD